MEAASIDGATRVSSPEDAAFWRPLLHRWFVQYNPLYLASSLLVLVGLTLVSRSSGTPTLEGELDVVAIVAEGYAFALIGGAWLLMRIGMRRPAVMLGLLAVLYQGDLTLLTERSAYLGLGGDVAVVAWLGAFALKLALITSALRLRLSRSALAVPLVGAFAVAMLPRWLDGADAPRKTAAVALTTFAVLAAGAWTRREVTSTEALDGWGKTVLARSLTATWTLWSALFLAHVGFTCVEQKVSAIALLPAAILLATRWLRGEVAVWCTTTLTLLVVGEAMPAWFASSALIASATLALRALRLPVATIDDAPPPRIAPPYRMRDVEPSPWIGATHVRFSLAPRSSRIRLLTGAVVATYLALWTVGWSAAGWPQHRLLLDVALTLVLALGAWRWRAPFAVLPLAIVGAHAAIQARLVTAPATAFAWGETAIVTGFVLLAVSLGVSYRLRPARQAG